ncbi:thyrotropin-releasing hormone receptor-like [Patiria miniata]|uniref:G-protein coupled receptors family 1 profile domain-containing protein n=1 Tax=Patiria miniata TaxID=46514 RepID=A0A914A1T8_PATMI|nr:thyrotropin-releasing hormone receptor-like [Patiria miniata]
MELTEVDMDGIDCKFNNILNLTVPSDAEEYVVAITEQLGIIVGMVAVLAFGLPGNLAFLFVVYKLPHMRTITNFFLANLAVADILFLVVTVFMYVIYLGASPVRSDYNVASLFSCVGVFLVPHITYFTSICCVTVVSLERFYAICKPIQHRAMNTKTRAKRLMLASWVVPVVLTAIAMPKYGQLDLYCIIWPDGEKYQNLPQILGFCRPVVPWWLLVGEFTTVSPFLIALPCNIFMYIRIVKSLSSRSVFKTEGQQRLPPQAVQVRNQVAKMLIINGIVFFLCQATNQFVTVAYMLSFVTGVPINDIFERLATVLDIGRIAVFVNSAVNPLIYNASSPHYRTAFKQAFGCSSKKSKMATATPAIIKSEEAAHDGNELTPSNSSPRLHDDYPLTLVQQTADEHRAATTEDDINLVSRENDVNTGVDNEGFHASPIENAVEASLSPPSDDSDNLDEQEKPDAFNIRRNLESIVEESST